MMLAAAVALVNAQRDYVTPSTPTQQGWEAGTGDGLVWWDRHTAKNGGTTVSTIMKLAEAHGDCLYVRERPQTRQSRACSLASLRFASLPDFKF